MAYYKTKLKSNGDRASTVGFVNWILMILYPSVAAFHDLVVVACYVVVPAFEGSSQKSSSLWFVTENVECGFLTGGGTCLFIVYTNILTNEQ
jgi:hypothetical protein